MKKMTEILKGFICISAPFLGICFYVLFFSESMFDMNPFIPFTIAFLVCWFYWNISTKFWIKQLKRKGFSKQEMHFIGSASLVFWNYEKSNSLF